MRETELYVYRHKDEKELYLIRKLHLGVDQRMADCYFDVTTDFITAIKNTLLEVTRDDFERCLLRKYDDDTVVAKIRKEFSFDGYTGIATKNVRYHLTDFEKIVFAERKE